MQVIKDNDPPELAVITGCLQIAKESIFTGTNNFVSDTISDTQLNEYWGFTQDEVHRLLADTGLTPYAAEIREWYDGYHFGNFDVYCSWDVMNHVRNLLLNPDSKPKNFRENTSNNAVIRTFFKKTDFDVNDKYESLLAGEYIVEPIEENLTYDILESSDESLWSLLYLTGYLTRVCPGELPGQYALKIPNTEVLGIFKKSAKAWLMETTARKARKDFIKMGLGVGRFDIVIKDRNSRRSVVLEAKQTYYEDQLESVCEEAFAQIQTKQYAEKNRTRRI